MTTNLTLSLLLLNESNLRRLCLFLHGQRFVPQTYIVSRLLYNAHRARTHEIQAILVSFNALCSPPTFSPRQLTAYNTNALHSTLFLTPLRLPLFSSPPPPPKPLQHPTRNLPSLPRLPRRLHKCALGDKGRVDVGAKGEHGCFLA